MKIGLPFLILAALSVRSMGADPGPRPNILYLYVVDGQGREV